MTAAAKHFGAEARFHRGRVGGTGRERTEGRRMNSSAGRRALSLCFAGLLAGCGVLQQAQDDTPPILTPTSLPPSGTRIAHAARGSWMPEAKSEDLIYADTPTTGSIYVFRIRAANSSVPSRAARSIRAPFAPIERATSSLPAFKAGRGWA